MRGPATSLATLAVWGFDLLIALTALSAIEAIGRPGTFFVYAAMNVLCLVFVALKVPETRSRSLTDIEKALRAPGSFRRNLASVARD
ncbi:MFS transporter [Streptomyces sp. NPDC048304]|uniref:MFS transporter n=1 Tax=Streptomyces sp. NPDC048304 TaxID=3154820 RepID=UPI003405D9D9